MIIAYDLEATGLLNPDIADSNYQPHIIEIGAVKIKPGGKLKDAEIYSQLVNPGIPIPPVVQKITSIDDAMVKDQPSFRAAFKGMAEFFTGATALVTFNGLGYDLPVLMHNLIANQLQYQFPWPPKHIDIMLAASDYLGMSGKTGNKPPKLSELYSALFGRDFPNAHRAYDDAKATLECALHLQVGKIIKL